MKKYLFILMVCVPIYAADNEIFIDQSSGASNSNIDLEQLGSGNIIGGADAAAGSMTDLNLVGTGLTLDINQIGDTNKFLGDIVSDSYTGFFEFDGNSNTFTLNQATTALASTLDLDWIINGSSNTITSSINVDAATNYVNIDGSDNALTHTATGYAGNYFYLDHDGSNRTFNITQSSTLDNDWLKILSSGTSTSTVCVIQNDQGTGTSC